MQSSRAICSHTRYPPLLRDGRTTHFLQGKAVPLPGGALVTFADCASEIPCTAQLVRRLDTLVD